MWGEGWDEGQLRSWCCVRGLSVPLSAVAAVLYLLVEPLFTDWEYWPAVFEHLHMVPDNMIFYMGLGVVVWFPAFLIATFMLGKLSKS